MKIKSVKDFYREGLLQRSLITLEDGTLLRRIAATVYPNGEVDTILDEPWWQAQLHDGDFQNLSEQTVEPLYQAYLAHTQSEVHPPSFRQTTACLHVLPGGEGIVTIPQELRDASDTIAKWCQEHAIDDLSLGRVSYS